jgi:hypothetical protein
VHLLNARAPRNVQYKVLFIGRHGDGLHNDAESYFGTPAWNVSNPALLSVSFVATFISLEFCGSLSFRFGSS